MNETLEFDVWDSPESEGSMVGEQGHGMKWRVGDRGGRGLEALLSACYV
jgi:hypothetical protein